MTSSKHVHLLDPIPDDHKPFWTVIINGKEVKVQHLSIESPFAKFVYGMGTEADGFDRVVCRQINGGGSVIAMYAFIGGELHLGGVQQERPDTLPSALNAPGAYLKPGETPFEAAQRLILAETGFDVTENELIPLGLDNQECSVFVTRNDSDGVSYFGLEISPEQLIPSTDGNYIFADGATQDINPGKQTINGTIFVPWHEFALSKDSFCKVALSLLLAHLKNRVHIDT